MPDFNIMETTIAKIHEAILNKTLTCVELIDLFLDRIKKYDQEGYHLNSIILINPEARLEAERLDQEFTQNGDSLTGPLHGIPVMLKDNFDTKDMQTTAGSMALKDYVPDEDAFVTKKLREAGAIILAKTNLHEFAIWGETISSYLGQTINPYDKTRTPGGSSGGTGASIAANFGVIGLGTDTINSVRSPAASCCLVGIRPTMGVVSRSGIVPYSLTQDTAGPICRTVEDAVKTLDVIKGYDPTDKVTSKSVKNMPDSYASFLNPDGIKAKRIGILRAFFGSKPENQIVNAVIQDALPFFEERGAELITIDEKIDSDWLVKQVSVHLDDFKTHVDQYLNHLPDDWDIHSLAEIVSSGKFHPGVKDNMLEALSLEIGTKAYNEKIIRQENVRLMVLKIMADNNLDALVYPHQQQLVCKVGSSQKQRNGVLCSVTGFPSVVVPAGFADSPDAPIGVPVGMEIIGRPYSEPTLIEIAYDFEQTSKIRQEPILDI